MDLLSILKNVQDVRAMLESYHITNGWLIAVGAIALFCFVLSTREVLGWYLRTNQLRDEVRELRKQIEALQALVEIRYHGGGSGGALDDDDEGEPSEKKSGRVRLSAAPDYEERTFKLNHWRKSL